MRTYKRGIVSVSFRKHTPREILQTAKNAGLECVEWGSDIHAPYDDLNKIKEMVGLQKEYKISCSAYGTYFKLGTSDINELEKYIYAAKLLGTDILRLWCGDKKREDYSETEKAFLMSECKKAAEIAEKNNVTLCMECHNKTYTETIDGALGLMNTVNSQNFLMYWQPNQFRSVEENIEYAEKISPYVKNIHVFNWKGRDRYPLEDSIDTWIKYLYCFDNAETLSLEFMPDDNIESLEKEANSLFKIAERMEK